MNYDDIMRPSAAGELLLQIGAVMTVLSLLCIVFGDWSAGRSKDKK
jgi:hypothetical protein